MAGKKRNLQDFAMGQNYPVQQIITTEMKCVKACRCVKHVVEKTTFLYREGNDGPTQEMYQCDCGGMFVEIAPEPTITKGGKGK